nr:hypothetical protein [Tanacetum cinerariifolium]
MILEPGDANREVIVTETFHTQTDDELYKKELKQIEADDQAIQTNLLGLLEDIYDAVDSCETAQKIWLRVQQMMKGSDIGIQDKKANQNGAGMLLLFIRPRFCTQLVTLNSPHQDQSSFNQNYLQQPMPNPEDIIDPTTAMNMALALMAKAFKLNYSSPTNNNQRISSNPSNRQIAQPSKNMGHDRQMPMVGGNGGNQFRNQNGLIGVQGNGNQNQFGNGNLVAARTEGNATGQNGNQIRCYNCRGVGHYARNCTVRPRRRDVAYLQTQLLIAHKEEAGIQLQAEEYDLIADAADIDEIEEVNANCILMANLQQASTSGTLTDNAPVYDSDGSAESDFKTREDKLLDKQIQLEKRIKELNNILFKAGQAIQTIHMLSPKPDSFYHTEHKKALGYQNPFYLKQSQKKQQSLYDVKVLLEKHGPPVVHDSEETLQLAQENDTTPSVARKFLNKVKSTIVTLQRVVKHIMTIETHNWSSSAHQELHKIARDENFPIVNQVDARVQNFEIQFLKEAAKFVGYFKSLANEADASLAKHKALELEIKRLLKAIVSQDIMTIVQNESVVDTSDL